MSTHFFFFFNFNQELNSGPGRRLCRWAALWAWTFFPEASVAEYQVIAEKGIEETKHIHSPQQKQAGFCYK